MPAKNVVKQYLENGYYHLYNRGVEKRIIFEDEQDYKVFLSYLKEYLEPKDKLKLEKDLQVSTSWLLKNKIQKKIAMNNYADKIDLLCYCLMPNHFHLLIKQKTKRGIENFMKSLGTRYAIYFNHKYKRVGGLFQSTYKAVLIETDEQLLHLSRYIHNNPSELLSHQGLSLLEYPYSSLSNYLGKWQTKWLKTKLILDFFSYNKNFSYKSFIFDKTIESGLLISTAEID